MGSTLSQLRALVRTEMGDDSTDVFSNTNIDALINDCLYDLSHLSSVNAALISSNKAALFLPFDTYTEITVGSDTTILSILGENFTSFTLQTDFINDVGMRVKSYDYMGRKVTYCDFDRLDNENDEDLFYYIRESTVILSDNLSTGDIIHHHYHKEHGKLTLDASEVNARLSGCDMMIVAYCAWRWLMRDRMFKDADYYKQLFLEGAIAWAKQQAYRQRGRPMWKTIDRKSYWDSISGKDSGVTVKIYKDPTNLIFDGGDFT